MAWIPDSRSRRGHTHSSTHHWPSRIPDTEGPLGQSTSGRPCLQTRHRSPHLPGLETCQSLQSAVHGLWGECSSGERRWERIRIKRWEEKMHLYNISPCKSCRLSWWGCYEQQDRDGRILWPTGTAFPAQPAVKTSAAACWGHLWPQLCCQRNIKYAD